MTYAEKLKNPLWQKKRLEILERDKWKCCFCDDTETNLQVHHLKYSKNPWGASNDDLVTLCEHCHLIAESTKTVRGIEEVDLIRVQKIPGNADIFIVAYMRSGIDPTKFGVLFFNYELKSKEFKCLVSTGGSVITKMHKFLQELKGVDNKAEAPR